MRSLLVLLALVVPVAHAATTGKQPIVVEDPHYGEVLFHFYQEDYFPAIVRLLAAQEQQQLDDHFSFLCSRDFPTKQQNDQIVEALLNFLFMEMAY